MVARFDGKVQVDPEHPSLALAVVGHRAEGIHSDEIEITLHLADRELAAPPVILVVDAPQGCRQVENVEGEIQIEVLLTEGGQLVLPPRDEEEGRAITQQALRIHSI